MRPREVLKIITQTINGNHKEPNRYILKYSKLISLWKGFGEKKETCIFIHQIYADSRETQSAVLKKGGPEELNI